VIPLNYLLAPSRPCDVDVPSFLKQVDCILSCLLSLDRLIGLDMGDPYFSSVGNTVSATYTVNNAVKLVDLLSIVHRF
jgi:hypothetical protein